mgnify:CR=1 FL=1
MADALNTIKNEHRSLEAILRAMRDLVARIRADSGVAGCGPIPAALAGMAPAGPRLRGCRRIAQALRSGG